MRIERDLKLTFDDVLIRPKRSTLISRSDVNLVRKFTFRHTEETWMECQLLLQIWIQLGCFQLQRFYRGTKC